MTKLILTLAVAAGAVTLTPGAVAAQDCTSGYVKCMNDTWMYSGIEQYMANLECGAKYAGCLIREVKYA